MDKHIEQSIAVVAQYTDEKPSAGAILIACQLSALIDAVSEVAKQLDYIDSGIDEANSLTERKLDRGN